MSAMSSTEHSRKYRLKRNQTESAVERETRLKKDDASHAESRAAERENEHEERLFQQAQADDLRQKKYEDYIDHVVMFHVLICKGTKVAILGACKQLVTFDEEWRALEMGPKYSNLSVFHLKEGWLKKVIILVRIDKLIISDRKDKLN